MIFIDNYYTKIIHKNYIYNDINKLYMGSYT